MSEEGILVYKPPSFVINIGYNKYSVITANTDHTPYLQTKISFVSVLTVIHVFLELWV